MATILIANVGNHDVQLTDPSLLPDELAQRKRIPARTLGNELAANYARYADGIELPIIGVCARWLLEHENVAPGELYIHLFASDQPAPPSTPESEWLKDSMPFAEVIKRHLLDGGLDWMATVEWNGKQRQERRALRLPKRQVHIHTITGNPADYKNTLDYFVHELPRLAAGTGEKDTVYLEVTGGTPAMTSMMIVAGVDAFGKQTHTLYVERGADRPYQVGIGQRFFARRARAAMKAQLELYAYSVAHATLRAEKDLITPDTERLALIAALLDYADRRLAFDFARARDALYRAHQYASGIPQSKVQYWQRELRENETANLLAELIHSASVKYHLGDYADFTQRLFRFQEASFRYLAERMGMRYREAGNNEYIDSAWIDEVAGLGSFLKDYTSPDGKSYSVRLESLNRINLGAIVDYFVQHDAQWTHWRQVAGDIHRLSSVAQLRNKGLAGHGFQGIGKQDLSEAFDDDADHILPLLEKIYNAVFEREIGANPYDAANDLIREILSA